MKAWILIAMSTALLSGFQEDLEAKKKQLAEVQRKIHDLGEEAKKDRTLENDKVWVDKIMTLVVESDKLAMALAGGDATKKSEVIEAALEKYAPDLYAGIVADRMKTIERNIATSLKAICTAEFDFRSNDRDCNMINDFWVGDVAGLANLVPLVPDHQTYKSPSLPAAADLVPENTLHLIDVSIANADAAPLKLEMWGRQPPAKPAPRLGYLFTALKKLVQKGVTKDYGVDTDGKTTVFGAVHSLDEFGFVAYPVEYGKPAKWTYLINQESKIWKKDTGGKVPQECPEDLVKAGWVKVE